jgi:hypothetical protein
MSITLGIGLGLPTYGLYAGQGGGGPVTPKWFVDSVGGNNANSGLSADQALQTIAAVLAKPIVAGDVVGLARGSLWKEIFVIPVNNLTIMPYGTGNPPMFDGADVMPSTWTNTSGTVYQQDWTRASVSGTEYLQVWIDGALPSRLATSVADLEANGGIFFTNRTNTTTTVFIKSLTDPNTSGVLYEAGKRSWAIDGHTATLGSTKTGQLITGLEATRCSGHYNAFAIGPGDCNQCIAHYGAIHFTVTEAATGEDVICKNMPNLYPIADIPYTAYTANGAGKTHTATRCMVIGDTSVGTHQGFYCHDSASGWDSFTLNQCFAYLQQIGCAVSFANLFVNGFYCLSTSQGVTLGGGATVQVKHSVIRENATAIVDGGPVDTTVRARLIENCIIFNTAATAGNAIGLNTRRGSLIVRNCLIINLRQMTGVGTTTDAGLDVTLQNNIMIGTGDGAGNYAVLNVKIGTGSYTANNNFYIYPNSTTNNKFLFTNDAGNNSTIAAWRTATGQEANSQVAFNDTNLLTKIFVDPANGNFTHTGTSGLTLPDGTPISAIGPQQFWNWNARAAVSGQPTKWPVPPASDAECRTYTANPAGWNFYP